LQKGAGSSEQRSTSWAFTEAKVSRTLAKIASELQSFDAWLHFGPGNSGATEQPTSAHARNTASLMRIGTPCEMDRMVNT
jgi:hypothetical protein